jgi:hypothetical protein
VPFALCLLLNACNETNPQAMNTPIEQSSQVLAQLAAKPVEPALVPPLAAQAPQHGPMM